MSENTKAIVLVSGGMDSLVVAASASIVLKRHCLFVHFSYGQKTATKEEKAFNDIAKYYQPALGVISIPLTYMPDIATSKLIQHEGLADIVETYVPFRNAQFLAIATCLAESKKIKEIYIGASQVDATGYPDCTTSFLHAFQKTINTGTYAKNILLCAPLLHMQKEETITLGSVLNVPFDISWSCYFSSKKACGVCDSCKLRLEAFKKAGLTDPIAYFTDVEE